MAMSIQRQADQYNLEVREAAPRLAPHEVSHLLHSGRRIQAGTLNTRQAVGGLEDFIDEHPDADDLRRQREREEYDKVTKRSPGIEKFISHPDDEEY